MENILVAATPAIVAALLAALGVWVRRRSRADRARRALEEARSRIAVISSWLDAHRALDMAGEHPDARRRALDDLERAYTLVRAAELAVERQHEAWTFKPLIAAAFLIDARPASALSKTLQILYYVSLAWACLWLAAALMFGLGIAFTDTSGSFGEQLAFSFGITLLCLAVGLVPSLILFLIFRASTSRP